MKFLNIKIAVLFMGSVLFTGCSAFDKKSGASATESSSTSPSTTSETLPPSSPALTIDDSHQLIPMESLPTKKVKGVDYPYAIKTQRARVVRSPYAQDEKFADIDVSGMEPGSLARCPHTGKIFVVP